MAGEGIAGILTQFIYLVMKASISGVKDENTYETLILWSTILYFVVSACFVIAAFIIWLKLLRMYKNIILINNHATFSRDSLTQLCKVSRKLIIPAVSIYFNFTITLSIFPSITILIPYNNFGRKNKLGEDN